MCVNILLVIFHSSLIHSQMFQNILWTFHLTQIDKYIEHTNAEICLSTTNESKTIRKWAWEELSWETKWRMRHVINDIYI